MNQGMMELPQWMGQDRDQDKLWAVATASKIELIHLPLMNLEMKDEESLLFGHITPHHVCKYISSVCYLASLWATLEPLQE